MRSVKKYKVNEHFGKRVKRARKEMDMSQEQAADMLGLSRNHQGRIERGEVNVSLVLAQKISRLLKKKSSELLPF